MTSFEMSFLVSERIRDRQVEADRERMARSIRLDARQPTPRPPRGPLFATVRRITSLRGNAG